jgi:nucleoid DNA-binding protein
MASRGLAILARLAGPAGRRAGKFPEKMAVCRLFLKKSPDFPEDLIDIRRHSIYSAHLTWTFLSPASRSTEGDSMAKKPATKSKAATKTALYQQLADATTLTRKQVEGFFVALENLIKQELSKKGPGEFKLPGLLKIKRAEKPATKARPGRDPRTGATITISAKPKRTVVKALALKGLKQMVL